MQNDLDADHHKILNLDTSNLPVNGPNDFPAQASKWLKSYSIATRNFSATQPLITEISGFPSQNLQGGKFLKTNGTALSWAIPQGSEGGPDNLTFLNVKQDPYNAVGDGVADDYDAIQQAILDAYGGLAVYFPQGTYRIRAHLAPVGPCTLIGDGPSVSIIAIDPNADPSYGVLTVQHSSYISKLGFSGRMTDATAPVSHNRWGIGIFNANGVNIVNCLVVNCGGSGILANGCFGITIRDCYVAACGDYGILVYNSPQSLIWGNRVNQISLSGIWLINSQYSAVQNNQVTSCGAHDYGVGAADSDNTVIQGNLCQQNCIGIGVGISSSRQDQQSYGYVITGNNVIRNYLGGIQLALADGFQLSSNQLTDNGQGGVDNATYTVEPGIIVDSGFRGTGRSVGEILTLVGGTGTAAKVMVARAPGGVIALNGLTVLSMGNYTVFPANPVATSVAGVKVIYTNTRILNAGTGYYNGQVLRGTNGTFITPVKVLVTSVGASGEITGYAITDGGGYTGSLPTSITFINDAYAPLNGALDTAPGSGMGAADMPETGSGFILTPSFGKRYSQNFNGEATYNISTLGPIVGGVLNSNMIGACATGPGILVEDWVAPYNGRADRLAVIGNSIIRNKYAIKGKTVGGPLDDNYVLHNLIANNLLYLNQLP
jgi:parallel beta-helix repeat protein